MNTIPELLTALESTPDAQCVTIFRNGHAKVMHRWGNYSFESLEDLQKWIESKQISASTVTKFKDEGHNPSRELQL